MRKTSLLLLPFVLAVFSCNNQTVTTPTSDSTATVPESKTPFASDWHTLTESWTASLDLKNASIMKSFYADTVMYYGDKISGNDVVTRQKAYFDLHPDYKMKLEEYIGEEQQPDGNWKIRITKAVTTDGKTSNYPASLVYAKRNGIWKIIAESDDITDLKKAQAMDVKYGEVTLEGLVEETTGFGVNTTGGDPKSDNKQTYLVIWPAQPLNVLAGEGSNVAEKNVDHVQLVDADKIIQPLLNKKVRITGTLQHGNVDANFTKVVMKVSKAEEVK